MEIENKRKVFVGSFIENVQVYKNLCCKNIKGRSTYKTLGVDANNSAPKYFII